MISQGEERVLKFVYCCMLGSACTHLRQPRPNRNSQRLSEEWGVLGSKVSMFQQWHEYHHTKTEEHSSLHHKWTDKTAEK